jgi:hypothetical protein
MLLGNFNAKRIEREIKHICSELILAQLEILLEVAVQRNDGNKILGNIISFSAGETLWYYRLWIFM